MKLTIDHAILDRRDYDSRVALHHLSRLGVDVTIQQGPDSLEYASAKFDGHDPNPDQAADISATIREIGEHVKHPVKVFFEYAGESSEFYIGPNAEKTTRQTLLRKAAYYARLAGEDAIASTLRGKAGH